MDYDVIIALIILFTLTHVAWIVGLGIVIHAMSKSSLRCKCTLDLSSVRITQTGVIGKSNTSSLYLWHKREDEIPCVAK